MVLDSQEDELLHCSIVLDLLLVQWVFLRSLPAIRACFERGEIGELRLRCLAYTTDVVSQYALGKSFALQEDQQRAEEWNATIRAVAKFAPLTKQFPWVLSMIMKLSAKASRCMPSELARLLQMHHVSPI